MIKPRSYEMRALRARHKLTRDQLASSLYDVKPGRIVDWENDRRQCPPMIWWAMVLTWDKIDLWADEEKWVKKFRPKKKETT